MQLTFLSADVPLVKKFTLENGELIKSPYPNAYLFTSHTFPVTSIEELTALTKEAADQGWCMLKGEVTRKLNNESRAGSTSATAASQFLCFDLDGLNVIKTPEEFMAAVGMSDVSYCVQYSASQGIGNSTSLSCHIFIMLSGAVSAQFIKAYITKLNLETKELASDITLTRTGNTLHWPLDITACQNDKLLYIAPPQLGKGVKDNFKHERIQLVQKKLPTLPTSRITADVNVVRIKSKEKLNELRRDAHMPIIRDSQFKMKGSIAYMSKPNEGIVTGIKHDRGFVYFNLNGGDSWAYYHPEESPEFIFNFKGEPTYKTEELLPVYWQSLKDQHIEEPTHGRDYFVLRDFRTDRLYNGYYDADTDDVVIARAANETRLKSFLKQHGQPVADFIPDWELVYDPSSSTKYDPQTKTINMYRPSEYYKLELRRVNKVPATIDKVIKHAVGPQEEYAHFLNWLAYVFQKRTISTTSWTLHGNQGTGKGVLFNRIIAPLLGQHNVHSMLMGGLQSQFNGWIETSLLVFVDEVQISKLWGSEQVVAALKNYTTEPMVSVRRMHSEAYRAKNHVNFIFASNQPDPVVIEATDRRNNVGRFQKDKLVLSQEDINQIDRELEEFFMFLMSYEVSDSAARTVLDSEDRKLLISINKTSVDEVADALLEGNLEYLIDQLPNSDDPIFATTQAAAYKSLIETMLVNGEEDKSLSRDELFVIYDYCVGNVPRSPNKFTSMLKHHRIYTKKVRRGDNVFYGIHVNWKHDSAWFEANRKKHVAHKVSTNVSPIKKAKV